MIQKQILSYVILILGTMAFLFGPGTVVASEYFVAPSGSPSGTGSSSNPWDLQTALDQPGSVNPGDTIWVKEGTYTGNYINYLQGSSSQPIIVRNYNNERVTIDGNTGVSNKPNLHDKGMYTWFWGLEFMNSYPVRISTESCADPDNCYIYGNDLPQGDGIGTGYQEDAEDKSGVGNKYINIVVHDTRQGIGFWRYAKGAEIYGSVIYNNGYGAADRGHGHGIYVQTEQNDPERYIKDNILFGQFSHGFHGYTSGGAYVDNLAVEGNIIFDQTGDGGRNFLLSSGAGSVVRNNYFYMRGGEAVKFDYNVASATIEDNYSYGRFQAYLPYASNTIRTNTVVGQCELCDPDFYTDNTFVADKATLTQNAIFIRPNQYESGRGHVVVYNWTGQDAVSVDISPVGIDTGAEYEVRNAQDYYGSPIISGTYTAGSISIPMTNLKRVKPLDSSNPDGTQTEDVGSNEFGAFIVIQTGSSGSQDPIPTPTPTLTQSPIATLVPTVPQNQTNTTDILNTSNLQEIYRFWSDQKQGHFYTASTAERDHIIETYDDVVWRYEGVAYQAFTKQVQGTTAVHRFWSDQKQGHFYTASEAERDYVIDHYDDHIWKYEGTAFYVYPLSNDNSDNQVYRFWSDQNQRHFYTASEAERDYVIEHYDDSIWRYEGIAWAIP